MSDGPRWEPIESPAPANTPQPMRLGQVLEVGVRILRRHWTVALVLALLFAGPGALLTAATGLHFTEVVLDVFPDLDGNALEAGATITESQLDRVLEAAVPYLAATWVAGVLLSIGALAFSAVVAADYHARTPALGEAVRAALRKTPSAIGFMLLSSLIIVGLGLAGLLIMGAATLIFPTASVAAGGPGVFLALVAGVGLVLALAYLTMRWAPAFPVMVEEGAGVREAFRRSWHLSGDNVWRIFVISFFAAVTVAIGGSALAQVFSLLLAGALAPALGLDERVAEVVAMALGSLLLAPLAPVLTAVLYFDLRTRRDAPPVAEPDRDPYR